MDVGHVSRNLLRVAVRRNLICACIAFPLVVLLVLSIPDNYQVTRNTDVDVVLEATQVHHQNKLWTRPSDSQGERLASIDNICQKVDVPGTVKGLYHYNNVTYCYNYKVASTYWMQIYRFLHKDVSHNVTKPSQISKFETHLISTRKIRLRYLFSKDNDHIMSSFRFMMVRDPYSRLWSVYVDKFLLLDNFFWSRYSPEMKRLMRHHSEDNDDEEVDDHTQKSKIQCLHVTFEEFLNYIAKRGQTKPENLDDHMRPIHYGCNPCFYKPDYVAKVEAMTYEKTPILQKLGLNNFDDVSDFKSHVTNEISMISDFEFQLWKLFKKTHSSCLSDVSLEEKMIRVFIINGYLPEDTLQRLRVLLPLGQEQFKSKVINVFLESSRNSTTARLQRERIRTEAYRTVSLSILEKIRNLFKYDFALFGYNQSPLYIFDNRQS